MKKPNTRQADIENDYKSMYFSKKMVFAVVNDFEVITRGEKSNV